MKFKIIVTFLSYFLLILASFSTGMATQKNYDLRRLDKSCAPAALPRHAAIVRADPTKSIYWPECGGEDERIVEPSPAELANAMSDDVSANMLMIKARLTQCEAVK